MPYFIIEGHGKDSGRKRKPTQVFAKDQDSAIAKAKKQGIVPDSVELVQVTHFVIDVAGISHPNHDGTDRQTIVKRCRTGEKLVLEQEVGNPYDVHAITVFRENGEQLGYVPAALAADVISWHQMGCRYSAVVVQIVPLAEDTKLLTVQVCVFVALADANLSRVAKYLSEEMARINPQWQVERFLPKQQIGAHPWVPVRQSPRDSSGRFSSPQPETHQRGEARQRPKHEGTEGRGKSGCLSLIVVGVVLGSGLPLFVTSIARFCLQILGRE